MDSEINDSYVKNTYDLSFKVVLLGDTGVGKSSIMYKSYFLVIYPCLSHHSFRYIKDEFYASLQPTLGGISL